MRILPEESKYVVMQYVITQKKRVKNEVTTKKNYFQIKFRKFLTTHKIISLACKGTTKRKKGGTAKKIIFLKTTNYNGILFFCEYRNLS